MIRSWDTAREKFKMLEKTWGFKADLARRLGVNPSVVQYYLNGPRTPGLDLLDRFAAALGIHAWELIKPSRAFPTDPRRLTAKEHLEEALRILKDLELVGVNLNPIFGDKPKSE